LGLLLGMRLNCSQHKNQITKYILNFFNISQNNFF
jgi:hypothetical protein